MRILLVKTSSLGDVIHNLPVASDIQRRFPEARIDWMVEENFIDIPRLHPAVGRVIPLAIRRWRRALLKPSTWHEIALFRASLQAVDYDLVLDSQGLLKSALAARLAHLSATGRRCGHSRDSARESLAARFYSHGYDIPRQHHAVERNRELAAAALGYSDKLAELPLDYGIRAEALQDQWLPPEPYAVLLSATSRDDKLWPEERWVTLGHSLQSHGLRCVLPAGSTAERQRASRIAARIPAAVVAPPLGIKALAQLFAGASQVVGLDTGLTHLAAALHRPTVALFTGSNPGLTGVHGGELAVNLGGIGQQPAVSQVLHALAGFPCPRQHG